MWKWDHHESGGYMPISPGFLALSDIPSSKDISVSFSYLWVIVLSLPPKAKQDHKRKRKKMHRLSSHSMQIQNSFKRTIQGKILLHQIICPSLLLLRFACFWWHYKNSEFALWICTENFFFFLIVPLALHCTHAYVMYFVFFFQRSTKNISTAVNFCVKYDSAAPPNGYI